MHTFVHGGHFLAAFWSVLMVVPTPLHVGLCYKRRDFAAWTSVMVRRPVSGHVAWRICGRRTIRRLSKGVWDPDFLPGSSK